MMALSGSIFETMKLASSTVAQQQTYWNSEAAAVRPMGVLF